MRLKLQLAEMEDAESVAALRNAASDDLTFKLGKGWWTSHTTTAVALHDLRNAELHVVLHRGEIIASLVLAKQPSRTLDAKYFSGIKRPSFLSSLTVAPELQRQGYGRACLAEAAKLARRAKAGAIFADIFDHPNAGPGPFFVKCGYREIARGKHRDATSICYQLPLGEASSKA